MATRFIISGSTDWKDNVHDNLTRAIGSVLETEIGTEPLSKHTVDGLIRLAADAGGYGKYVDIDKVFTLLLGSGFFEKVTV